MSWDKLPAGLTVSDSSETWDGWVAGAIREPLSAGLVLDLARSVQALARETDRLRELFGCAHGEGLATAELIARHVALDYRGGVVNAGAEEVRSRLAAAARKDGAELRP